jgi:hypothetical protein
VVSFCIARARLGGLGREPNINKVHYTSLSRVLFTLPITTMVKIIFYSGSINSCDANLLVGSTVMLVGSSELRQRNEIYI